ncbi:hypothetical protein TNCV_167661 [Trichonephila clavipes]|nr:hypothetical protein TNCV_167661 [Trichonephila clavipes]
MLKITHHVSNPDFPCVVRAELAAMCFISYYVANTIAIVPYCKLSQKNIATIAWTGIIVEEERRRLILRRINNQRN